VSRALRSQLTRMTGLPYLTLQGRPWSKMRRRRDCHTAAGLPRRIQFVPACPSRACSHWMISWISASVWSLLYHSSTILPSRSLLMDMPRQECGSPVRGSVPVMVQR